MAWLNNRGVLTGAEQNAVKGLLIALVVFGHIHLIQHHFRPVYDVIYTFHVAAFLILPFLLPAAPFKWDFPQRRFIRYTVPFFWFFTAATIMFATVFLISKGITIPEVLCRYLFGLATASTKTLDAASGLKLFWFLPTLFTLVVLYAAYGTFNKSRSFILVACIAINMLAGEFGQWRYYIPWGLLIAMYVLPLGLLVSQLFNHSQTQPTSYRVLLILFAVLSLALAWQTGLSMNLGDLTLPGIITNPGLWLVTNMAMASATLAIYLLSPLLSRVPLLQILGSLSLAIYLIHGFVNQGFEMVILPRLPSSDVLLITLQFGIVLAISAFVALALTNLRIFSLILFPRDGNDLLAWKNMILKPGKR